MTRLPSPARCAAALAGVVLLAGCGGSSSAAGARTTAPAAPSASPSASAPASPAASPAADTTITLTYANGKVSGASSRVSVRLGSTVALVVTSDVADEVHLHGYDKHVDVAKGGTATLLFKATIPGIFEAELESLKHRLVQIEVK